jgi:hypothetical protein
VAVGAGAVAVVAAEVSVLAPFEPLATLVRRSPTLDGSVPVRVAQGCLPLLEGNAFGLQVRFERPIVARTRLGRATLVSTPDLDAVDRVHRSSSRYLVEHGVLRGAWARFFEHGWHTSDRGRLRMWTGLCVKPGAGHWLRVSATKNRGVHGLDATEAYVTDDEFVPLVVDFILPPGEVCLVGEVATLAIVRPGVRVSMLPLSDAAHLTRAHAAFYDAAYFAKKRGDEITRKYRRQMTQHEDDPARECEVRVAHIAGPKPIIQRELPLLSASSARITTKTPPLPFDRVRFSNAVPFSARYDGYSVDVEPDRAALAQGASDVRAALDGRLDGGALLYLTKYFTPHPRGEPHFFVKPWAFVETSPGWSSLLEGTRGASWDVMRGVVRTDAFHAAPAVFRLHGPGRIRVDRGEDLLDVLAVPRSVLDARVIVQKEV